MDIKIKKKGKTKKVFVTFIKTVIFFIILMVIIIMPVSAYFFAKTTTYFEYRYEDDDGDGLKNIRDDDIDGDTLINELDDDADGDTYGNIDDIVNNGKELVGKHYDFFRGKFFNYGGRVGWVVDVDVPLIAYEKAGFYFSRLMKEDFNKHPENYDASYGNNPDNPFFHRRIRNLLAYFKSIEKLYDATYTEPLEADIVFLKDSQYNAVKHVALIISIDNDGGFTAIEASMKYGVKEVTNLDLMKRGYSPAYYGRYLN